MTLSYFTKNNQKYNFYLALFIIAHVVIWTALPSLCRYNIPMDTLEAVSWGHGWQLGYYKHPPLSAYLAELTTIIFQQQFWALYLLSQACVALCMIATWCLAKRLLSTPQAALMATLLLEAVYYYNYTSTEFNTNILLLPIWSLTILYTWQAFNDNRLRDWIYLGIVAGLGILTKYYAALLDISIILLMLYQQDYRKYFKTPRPYLAALIALLILAPHIIWLKQNNFPSFDYASSRSEVDNPHFYDHLIFPVLFIFTQTCSIALALIIFFITFPDRFAKKIKINCSDSKTIFLMFTAILPILLTVTPSLIWGNKIKDMWGTTLWSTLGICLFYFLKPMINQQSWHQSWRRFLIAWVVVFTIAVTTYTVTAQFHGKRDGLNSKLVQSTITTEWQKYSQQPIEIIAGDMWLASDFAFNSNNRPQVFIDIDINHSPWLSYQDFENKGGIIIWNAKDQGDSLPGEFTNKVSNQIVTKQPITLNSTNPRIKSFRIGWAVVIPK